MKKMYSRKLLISFFLIPNTLACMEFNGVFIPREIVWSFIEQEETPWEQLQRLLLLQRVNKYFRKFSIKKLNAMVAAQDHILNADYKKNYLENSDSPPIAKENVFFALALQKDSIFWLFKYLKKKKRRNRKIDALVHGN